ncbi:hypothetical protein QL285_091760 [Trifolium repens]|nr:hypothetical protein QL285_091760 [Trifolium repens]
MIVSHWHCCELPIFRFESLTESYYLVFHLHESSKMLDGFSVEDSPLNVSVFTQFDHNISEAVTTPVWKATTLNLNTSVESRCYLQGIGDVCFELSLSVIFKSTNYTGEPNPPMDARGHLVIKMYDVFVN